MQAFPSNGEAESRGGGAIGAPSSCHSISVDPLANTTTCQKRAAVQAPLKAASKQVRSYAADAKASPTEVSSILEQRIRGVQEEAGLAETGRVLSVGYVITSKQAESEQTWTGSKGYGG